MHFIPPRVAVLKCQFVGQCLGRCFAGVIRHMATSDHVRWPVRHHQWPRVKAGPAIKRSTATRWPVLRINIVFMMCSTRSMARQYIGRFYFGNTLGHRSEKRRTRTGLTLSSFCRRRRLSMLYAWPYRMLFHPLAVWGHRCARRGLGILRSLF
jgi:hypothetical protein